MTRVFRGGGRMAELSAHAAPARPRDVPGGARKAARPRKGEAQQATAAGLDLLRALGWLVLHDVVMRRDSDTTVDHVLAGPSGVYVVNTVSWSGPIAAQDGRLSVGGVDRGEALTEVATAADDVRALLGEVPVAALLCFERLEAVAGVAGDVALCASENILDLLTGVPEILDSAAVAAASHVLVTAFRAASDNADDTVLPSARPGPTLDELVKAKAAERLAE